MIGRRRLIVALSAAGLTLVAMATTALPAASADTCVVTVEVHGGQTYTFSFDAPSGTPLTALPVPAVDGVIVSETDSCDPTSDVTASATGSTSSTGTTSTTDSTSSPTSSTASSSSPTASASSSSSTSTSSSPASSSTAPSAPTPTTGSTSSTPASTSTSGSSSTTTTSSSRPALPKPTGPSRPEKRSAHTPKAKRRPKPAAKPKKAKPKSQAKPKTTAKTKTTTKTTSPASSPGFSLSVPGPAPIGVPNFFIDSFQIPPFLLPIYQAAGIEYQVPWQILAAINEIETDYGRNLSVSSAGAVGWMQFLPSTWKEWGVDATGNGVADPYNPVDAIFTAARYLHAAGASTNLAGAIFAYNHADWYVQSVLLRAKLIGGIPSQLIGALTGLVEGHFPVAAPARYADDAVVSLARRHVTGSNAAIAIGSDPASRGTSIYGKPGSPVIAVNDGKILKIGDSARLGHYIELQDSTGNIYTYAQLGSVTRMYPVPKPVKITPADIAQEMAVPTVKAPTTPASAGSQAAPGTSATATRTASGAGTAGSRTRGGATGSRTGEGATGSQTRGGATGSRSAPATTQASATQTLVAPLVKERLFAYPTRPASYASGGDLQVKAASPQITSFQDYFSDTLHLAKNQYTLQPLKRGAIVIAGTILGRIGASTPGVGSHLYFMIQPAGRNAPYIDPKPILDGWKLLEATAVYRANGVDPFFGPGAKNPTVGQILLMSEQQLQNRVLSDPHVQIYACGRRDIQAGLIDRRVLATIEFLSASGLDPYVSGLECGHSLTGSTGTDAAGATGASVDISKINGIPILDHQGPGSITDLTIRRLLTLQGLMRPDQIISTMSYRGQPTTLALPDHANRVQITFTPDYGTNQKLSDQIKSLLQPGQWIQLINRISQIPEPVVPIAASKYAIRTSTAG